MSTESQQPERININNVPHEEIYPNIGDAVPSGCKWRLRANCMDVSWSRYSADKFDYRDLDRHYSPQFAIPCKLADIGYHISPTRAPFATEEDAKEAECPSEKPLPTCSAPHPAPASEQPKLQLCSSESQAMRTATDIWSAINTAMEKFAPERGPCFKESMRDKLAATLKTVFDHHEAQARIAELEGTIGLERIAAHRKLKAFEVVRNVVTEIRDLAMSACASEGSCNPITEAFDLCADKLEAALNAIRIDADGPKRIPYAFCCNGGPSGCDCVNPDHGTALDASGWVRFSDHESALTAAQARIAAIEADLARVSEEPGPAPGWLREQMARIAELDGENEALAEELENYKADYRTHVKRISDREKTLGSIRDMANDDIAIRVVVTDALSKSNSDPVCPECRMTMVFVGYSGMNHIDGSALENYECRICKGKAETKGLAPRPPQPPSDCHK